MKRAFLEILLAPALSALYENATLHPEICGRRPPYPKLLRILERFTSVMCVIAIAQPSRNVPHAMQDAPDVNVIVALDVEDQVRIAL